MEETEGVIKATQDTTLTTKKYLANIIKMDQTLLVDGMKKTLNQLAT